jgi:hypothetical protein
LEKSIYLERYSRLARDVEQVIDDRLDQRNSFAASDRFGFPFRVAGDQRAVGAGRQLGIAEDVNPFVDLLFELVLVDEAIDLHGAEEIADTGWSKRPTVAIHGLVECELYAKYCYNLLPRSFV